MTEFLLVDVMIWLPKIFAALIFVTAFLIYVLRNSSTHKIDSKILNLRFLLILTILGIFFYAIIKSVGQYYVWSGNTFTSYLLNSPLSEDVPENFITKSFPALFQSNSGYFLYYAYGRFLLNPIIALIVSFAFYTFLKSLQKYQDRFFDTGEVQLGFLCALLVGWPNFVVFIPLAFLSVIVVSIIRGVVYKEAYTTLGYPFLLATLVCLLYGEQLISLLNLTVLKA